jgi:hypothetical protein
MTCRARMICAQIMGDSELWKSKPGDMFLMWSMISLEAAMYPPMPLKLCIDGIDEIGRNGIDEMGRDGTDDCTTC